MQESYKSRHCMVGAGRAVSSAIRGRPKEPLSPLSNAQLFFRAFLRFELSAHGRRYDEQRDQQINEYVSRSAPAIRPKGHA